MSHHLSFAKSLTGIFLFSILGASAFENTYRSDRRKPLNIDSHSPVPTHREQSRLSASLFERMPIVGVYSGNPRKNRKCRCPDDDNPNDDENDEDLSSEMEDRREAVFAMIGSLWAASSVYPDSAAATAGVDANMAFPDVVGGMNDRNSKQCLVESLGNRECLVYKETDPEKLLYKGINAESLVEKVQKATNALSKIPPLVEVKKWNEITGILTGPMGELSSALTMLAGDNPLKTKLARKVKEDLFGMGTATSQRQPEAILKYHALAVQDLANFLEAAL